MSNSYYLVAISRFNLIILKTMAIKNILKILIVIWSFFFILTVFTFIIYAFIFVFLSSNLWAKLKHVWQVSIKRHSFSLLESFYCKRISKLLPFSLLQQPIVLDKAYFPRSQFPRWALRNSIHLILQRKYCRKEILEPSSELAVFPRFFFHRHEIQWRLEQIQNQPLYKYVPQ